MERLLILGGALLWGAPAVLGRAPPATIVKGWEPGAQELAVYVCQGLYSRDPAAAVYTVANANDEWWLSATGGGNASAPGAATAAPAFLRRCLGDFPRVVLFNWTAQQELLPSIVTAAAVLDAVPLEAAALAALAPAAPPALAFDAVLAFGGMQEIDSVAYVFDRWGNLTTGLCKLNPGWHWDADPLHTLSPVLAGGPSIQLVDYVVKERLFNFFLKNGCIPLTAEHALLERMLADDAPGSGTSRHWPRPLTVYGYDNSHPLFGGDVFEAETTCVAAHNMGQVASAGVTNLAYFSADGPLTEPLLQLPDPLHGTAGSDPPYAPLAFNASRTYVAFTIGDGDNVQYVQNSRADWMKQRAARCAAGGGPANRTACYPLLWSLSPALIRLSPDWARWFFATARSNGADWFVLPPSGDTYAYPSKQVSLRPSTHDGLTGT